MQTLSVKNIDNQHSEWKSVLGFYKDELSIFNNRLTEVAAKNTTREVMQMVEHFQNQFLVQAENIDILQHDINEHVSTVAKQAQQYAGHIDQDQIPAHSVLQQRFEDEEDILRDIRATFMEFLSKVM